MKKFILSLIYFTLIVTFLYANDKVFYYDERGEKIYLEKDSNVKFIHFADSKSAQNSRLLNQLEMQNVKVETRSPLFFKISGNLREEDINNLLLTERNRSNTFYISDLLMYNDSTIVCESDEIIVKFFPETHIQELLDTNGIPSKEFRRLGSNPQTYLIKLDVSKQSAINYANILVERKAVEHAQPSLWRSVRKQNALFSSQWGLYNIGQYGGNNGIDIKATRAWKLADGQGVKVAVLDEGIDLTHPDLACNLLPGYDATDGADGAVNGGYGGFCDLEDSHGTTCAGIIAACDNSIGIKGVAYNSKIIPIRIAYSINKFNDCGYWNWNDSWTIDAIYKAWYTYNADILSNSWETSFSSAIALNAEIDNAVMRGRGGKGCIVIFAAGNDNSRLVSDPACKNNVIAVGAISPCGERKSPDSCDGENWGSNYGDDLDVMAPGVLVTTTDIQGGAGYNPKYGPYDGSKIKSDCLDQNYTIGFNGTSAACPYVAGVAALILSINPSLTGPEVRNIIESTAQKTGGYNYQTKQGRPNGTWCEDMGYGLVNAYTAVQKAPQCVDSFSNQIVTGKTIKIGCSDLNVWNVTVTNNSKLILDAPGEVTINGPFEVQLGSELDI